MDYSPEQLERAAGIVCNCGAICQRAEYPELDPELGPCGGSMTVEELDLNGNLLHLCSKHYEMMQQAQGRANNSTEG